MKDAAVDFECTYGLGLYLFTGSWGWEYCNMSKNVGSANNSTNGEICIIHRVGVDFFPLREEDLLVLVN